MVQGLVAVPSLLKSISGLGRLCQELCCVRGHAADARASWRFLEDAPYMPKQALREDCPAASARCFARAATKPQAKRNVIQTNKYSLTRNSC
eukprot:4871530-Amphidinium_carterae.1